MEHALVGDARDLAELGEEYEIVGELGRGGSATVYRARDRALGRDVAIKVVHPRPLSAGDDPVARLAREARTVAQLHHAHIVTVFAVRRLHTGGLALVMQCVPGRTLKTVIQEEGPLPAERTERILRDVGEALAYAHARGIVHRDVKPENIFLDEETGRALLSDFGIARSGETESLTMTGTAIGTPFYMSPEQVEGGALDGRSDLYSLGLVAWEMLTGKRPWDGESLYNVIYKQKHEELPPIEALRPGDVPQRLQYIVERMLQKRPAARWAGADGLLVQLGRSVLPNDFARWQAALPRRVERWRAAEEEREARDRALRERLERERSAAPTDGDDGSAGAGATVRFATGGPAPLANGAHEAPAARVALANTMAFERGALPSTTAAIVIAPEDVDAEHAALAEAVARAEPAPVVPLDYSDAAEPTWEVEDAAPPEAAPPAPRRGRAVAFGATALLGVVAVGALVARDRLPSSAAALLGSASRAPTGAAVAAAVPAAGVPVADGRPAPLPSGVAGEVVAVGGRHSCVVGLGAVHCWGANDRGQLGDGTLEWRTTPGRVVGDLSFVRVTSGLAHVCGLTRLGDVYCWGNDARGQLGDATTIRRNAPVRVAGDDRYTAVEAGGAFTCALSTGRALLCWGANDRGQLGDGSNAARTVPTRVRVDESLAFRAVTAGTAHACALTDEGRALCWGAGTDGQLGDDEDHAQPVEAARGTRFTALAAGGAHTCGVAADGGVRCWGRNDNGQLGTGDYRAISEPAAVRLPAEAAPIVALSAGTAQTCALDARGAAWCWGRNTSGQLGDGTFGSRPRPVRVRSADPLAAVATGVNHTCGLTAAGRVLCWGANIDGQVGDSTRLVRPLPTPTLAAPIEPAGGGASVAQR